MSARRIPGNRPAPVATLPPRGGAQSVTFSMARSVTFSVAIDIWNLTPLAERREAVERISEPGGYPAHRDAVVECQPLSLRAECDPLH